MVQSCADEWLPACLLSESRFPFRDSQQQTVTSLGNSILQTREIPGVVNESIAGFLTAQVLQTHYDSETERICFVLPVVLDHCLWQWPQSPADDEILCTYEENGPTCMPLDRLNWAYAEKIVTSISCMETECWDLQLALKLIF